MKINEKHINEALKIWEEIDENTIEAVFMKFAKEQPILVSYMHDMYEDFELDPELEDEITELSYIIYLAFKQGNGNIPQIDEKVIDQVDEDEEKTHYEILEKLGVSKEEDEEKQILAIEKFNKEMAEAMQVSEEAVLAFVKKHKMEDLMESMFGTQPELENYLNQEILSLEDSFDGEELSIAYELLGSFIRIVSKATEAPKLKIVK
ncbi:MAG: hypothetical protein JXR58_12300 [Bacteroidales bacterium]|nr:hypothetical protein [Bacteroidales bacterium]